MGQIRVSRGVESVPDESRSCGVLQGSVIVMERQPVVLDREVIESNLCFELIFWLLCEEWTGRGVEIGNEIRRD